ncbi:hypothetical protein [Variovorax atrisoli]|uniref:hypothetical protein n=1 Tax=Variovorax atrisoli TaxID=3394203 RepID=UPI004040329E
MIVITSPRPRRPKQPQRTGPVGGLADGRFHYTPAVATDIRKTFKRIRAEMQRGAQR